MTRFWRVVLILSLLANLGIAYVAYKAWEYRSHINEFRDKYLAVVDEFSQRNYYRDANAALGEPSSDRPRIVLFGTQVIERWPLADSPDRFEMINRGVSGQRAAGFLLRFKSDVLDLRPAAVVIEVSSYNLRPQYRMEELEDYVVMMTDLARAHGIEPVLATPVPPLAETLPLEGYNLMDSLREFSGWLRAYAAERGLPLLDMGRLLADQRGYLRPDYAEDAIDPNADGYAVLSDELIGILERLLPTRAPQ